MGASCPCFPARLKSRAPGLSRPTAVGPHSVAPHVTRRLLLGVRPVVVVEEHRRQSGARRLSKAKATGSGDGRSARLRLQLGKDGRDVVVDGAGADEEGLGDLPVRASLNQPFEDLKRSSRQARPVGWIPQRRRW